MGVRIHQLPAAIANQIAAGEVIERPASVVKELLENAYDAGASAITVEIQYGGLNQIKISDNGCGIYSDDLPLALAAHATSKITTLNDLYAINSMGFRGEALASIASIAKVTISSRPASQAHAMSCFMEGEAIRLLPCARSPGTTIDVMDLFFNAPVRKRFLKSQQLEFQAIEAVAKRFALSAPAIALSLKHNGKLIWSLPSALNEAGLMTRMTQLFGRPFVKEAICLDIEHMGMRLHGWISGPNYHRSQNDKQWVYINQRMVKDKLINHALKLVYDGRLHPGRFPACLLYLSLPSAEVDVNVHPTKHEVRFAQPRLVHDFLTTQLIQALGSQKKAPSVDEDLKHYTPQALVPALIEQPNSTKKTVIDIELEHSWVVLNQNYALVLLPNAPCLVDVRGLYKHYLLRQLTSMALPLAQRPLLVPLHFKVTQPLQWQALLAPIGMQVKVQDDDLVLLSLPVALPHLDVRLFLDFIEQTKANETTTLFHALSESQRFDIELLSRDERLVLNQYLLSCEHHGLFSKALTEEHCRMFLNA